MGAAKSTTDGDLEDIRVEYVEEDPQQPLDQSPSPITVLPPATPPSQTSLKKLEAVYGAKYHLTNGTQFDGGIAANKQR